MALELKSTAVSQLSKTSVERTSFPNRIDALAIAAIVLLAGPVYLYHAVVHAWPMGFAGLYSLMAELIAANSYALPFYVPYYGPGGMPFAYPPFALYVMAATTEIVPTFTYLSLAPPLFSMLSLVAMYLLASSITRSRFTALVAALLLATSGVVLGNHLFADGSVRALAFALTLLGLWSTLHALEKRQPIILAAAAFLFGLTIATHLMYAMFFGLSLVVFVLCSIRKRIVWGVLIAAGGAIVAAPWWLTVSTRYGVEVFSVISTTHGDSMESILSILDPSVFLNAQLPRIMSVDNASLGYAVSLLGLIFCLFTRRWLLPLWFFAIVLVMPDGQRFWVTVGAIAGAIAIIQLSTSIPGRLNYAFVAVLLLLPYQSTWAATVSAQPGLSQSYLDLAVWMREETPQNTRYLFLSTDQSEAEWSAYLFRRVPIAAPWGAEWTGQYGLQYSMFAYQADCVRVQSLNCVERIYQQAKPDYLVVPRLFSALSLQLQNAPSWTLRFANEDYAVWESVRG
ncbi:MAG: glycosyltransferase family 39 protein [Chloroflexi bacterium]|nr:glycosyltransferase family 39 protein [Chloroflexota bacterium]